MYSSNKEPKKLTLRTTSDQLACGFCTFISNDRHRWQNKETKIGGFGGLRELRCFLINDATSQRLQFEVFGEETKEKTNNHFSLKNASRAWCLFCICRAADKIINFWENSPASNSLAHKSSWIKSLWTGQEGVFLSKFLCDYKKPKFEGFPKFEPKCRWSTWCGPTRDRVKVGGRARKDRSSHRHG